MSTNSGQLAEERAAEYLEGKGFTVIERNWRRPRCEIDIIATKKQGFRKPKTTYLIEVKYRRSSEQGSGIDYITPAKQKQMKFAGEMWSSENNFEGDYELGAIEVTGQDFEITLFLPTLDIN